MKNLLIRTLSGAVFVALMVAGVYIFPLMVVLLCAVACAGIYECSRLVCGPVDRLARGVMMTAAVALFAVVLYYGLQKSTFFFDARTVTLFAFMLTALTSIGALLLVLPVAELFRHRPAPIEHIGSAFFAYCWIVLPLGLIAVMTRVSPPVVLAFFLLTWSYDTFAYLGGSLYGRNKMCGDISPKKTWEGAVTGLLLALVVAIILPSIPFFGSLCAALWKWVVLAVLVVLFGTMGDLLESLIKRRAGVKDSGSVLPGHGGVLDRLDSMLMASVPVLLYALFVMVP